MDYDKLIEQLHKEAYGSDIEDLLLEAATALSTLQAENSQLRESRDHWKRLAHELSEGINGKDAEHERLQAENEKLRAELEQVKQLYETEKEDFGDFACSGVPNLSPYCMNRHPDCVDERGWCRTEKCQGFSRELG